MVLSTGDYTPLSLDDVKEYKGFQDVMAPKAWSKRFSSSFVDATFEAPLSERRKRWEKEGRLSPPPQWKSRSESRRSLS